MLPRKTYQKIIVCYCNESDVMHPEMFLTTSVGHGVCDDETGLTSNISFADSFSCPIRAEQAMRHYLECNVEGWEDKGAYEKAQEIRLYEVQVSYKIIKG